MQLSFLIIYMHLWLLLHRNWHLMIHSPNTFFLPCNSDYEVSISYYASEELRSTSQRLVLEQIWLVLKDPLDFLFVLEVMFGVTVSNKTLPTNISKLIFEICGFYY